MNRSSIGNDMFRQLQEVMSKCDSLSHQLNDIKNEHKKEIRKIKDDFVIEKLHLENRLVDLEKENKELKARNTKLENEVDRLKAQINKDSNNSSKPPSSDNKNIANNREKTNRKNGGQKGHKGVTYSKSYIEEKIKKGEVEHVVVNHGNINSDDYEVRYEVSAKMVVTVKEHRFYRGSNGKYNIPNIFKNNVVYGDEVKSICTLLSSESSTPINKVKSIIGSLTNNVINLSGGTIANFIKEFSYKAIGTIDKITDKILNGEIMYTDETGSRENGKRISIRNYSNEKHTLFKVSKSKSKASIEKHNILNRYEGDIVHDHDTSMYSYARRNLECNSHVGRYLRGNTENAENKWSRNLRNFLFSINETRNNLKDNGINCFSVETLKRLNDRYDEILEQGFQENKKTLSKVYRHDEKRLLNRLKKYKENHLYFMHDFTLPFTNNLSERDLRVFKTKTKMSGGFRSFEGAEAIADILSIVKTTRKQGKNAFEAISNIYRFSATNI